MLDVMAVQKCIRIKKNRASQLLVKKHGLELFKLLKLGLSNNMCCIYYHFVIKLFQSNRKLMMIKYRFNCDFEFKFQGQN